MSAYREHSNFVRLVDHVRAHRLILAVQGRLVDYAAMFERDLYFATLGLLAKHGLKPHDLFGEEELTEFSRGRVIYALGIRNENPILRQIVQNLKVHFPGTWGNRHNVDIRNEIAHLELKRLTYSINQARELMAYDRKLKNAISKSVIELLYREGINLKFIIAKSGDTHDLSSPVLSSRSATHLGGKKLVFNRLLKYSCLDSGLRT
ncbi:type VI-A CRISPR-associated RNA-guided ribonuclease Cas13a [Rhodomicrobium sp. Az07]|uniref:type VI-A CRISPR-associated RNA-guided ribonuclease Cas13a n=1 Tax=Rhodomicrobium sp. Az07 TaxID=2839034 RepID=UPI003530529F